MRAFLRRRAGVDKPIVRCPVCDSPVNREATGCPNCGGSPRLSPGEADAFRHALADANHSRQVRDSVMLSGWSRRTRFLAAIPALAPGLTLAVIGVVLFVHEARYYFSLPVSVRTEDGDPFPASAGMWFDVAVVIAGLLLLMPGLVVTLPRRFSLTLMVVAFLPGAIPLVVASFTLGSRVYAWLPFAYVPVLAMLRLYLQRRADRRYTQTRPSPG
jgi:hypothetical protein